MRVSFEEMKAEIKRVMLKAGLSEEKAEICAQTHTETSRDGVYSHGLNRVTRFFKYCERGWVNPDGEPELVGQAGLMENYDGNLGPGITNAKFCSKRAAQLAKKHGIGVVALRNTTHWMRGGTYAWDIANKGFIGIAWTNTESSIPAWGSKEPCVGNNPLCIAIPREEGNVVLDMAMSLYSFGKLQVTRLAGEQLPYPGGYDKDGNVTSDPGALEESGRLFPTGYWKGSGLTIVLDMLAAILSNGNCTAKIDEIAKGSCGSCSQIFIAINPYMFASKEEVDKILEDTINQIHAASPVTPGRPARYPGEGTLKTRKENDELGILVNEEVWNRVRSL